jgi:hypothetical protein
MYIAHGIETIFNVVLILRLYFSIIIDPFNQGD